MKLLMNCFKLSSSPSSSSFLLLSRSSLSSLSSSFCIQISVFLLLVQFVSCFIFIPNQDSYLTINDYQAIRSSISELHTLFFSIKNDHNSSVHNLPISSQCKQFLINYSSAKLAHQAWPYEVEDASGKPASGIIKGNLEFMGDFDECVWIRVGSKLNPWLDSESNFHVFRGKYCTLNVAVKSAKNTNLTGFLVEKEARFGLCSLSACSKADLQVILDNHFNSHAPTTVNILNCDGLEERQHSTTPKFVQYSLWTLAILLISGTLMDLYLSSSFNLDRSDSLWVRLITSFSLPKNINSILYEVQTPEQSRFINIFKALSMLLVFHGHSNMTLRFVSKSALNKHYDLLTKPSYHMVIAAGFLSVDMFLFISATITVKIVLPKFRRLMEKQATNTQIAITVMQMFWYRYVRLMPSLIFLMICHVFFENFMLGPLWTEYSELWLKPCRTEWLANVLLINNLLPWNPEKANCAFHSWHLGLDMQLFVYSILFFIILIIKRPGLAIKLNTILLMISIIGKGFMTAYYGYPPMVLSGNRNRENLYFEQMYTKPWLRADPYIIGLFFGYFCTKKITFNFNNRTRLALHWLIGLTMLLIVTTPAHYHVIESFSSVGVALYAATHRALWAICLSWIFYNGFQNENLTIRSICNWRLWEIISNISYQFFLFHPLFFMIYFGAVNSSLSQRVYQLLGLEPAGILTGLVFSFGAALMVEWPIHQMLKVVRGRSEKKMLESKLQ